MQGHDCKAAFLSKGKSMTAPVPRRASLPGSASSLRATDRGKMEQHSWQGLASPTGLTFSSSLQREPPLHPQRWESPGQRFRLILLSYALPAGETMKPHGEPGGQPRPGQSRGLCPGQAPQSFSGEPRSAAGAALFRVAAGRG